MRLPEHTPDTFNNYVAWLYQSAVVPAPPSKGATERDLTGYVLQWILGEGLLDRMYQAAVLAMLATITATSACASKSELPPSRRSRSLASREAPMPSWTAVESLVEMEGTIKRVTRGAIRRALRSVDCRDK